jgi:hypothetical protein
LKASGAGSGFIAGISSLDGPVGVFIASLVLMLKLAGHIFAVYIRGCIENLEVFVSITAVGR